MWMEKLIKQLPQKKPPTNKPPEQPPAKNLTKQNPSSLFPDSCRNALPALPKMNLHKWPLCPDLGNGAASPREQRCLWKWLFTPPSLSWHQMGSYWHWLLFSSAVGAPLVPHPHLILLPHPGLVLLLVGGSQWLQWNQLVSRASLRKFGCHHSPACAALDSSGSFGWSCNDDKGKMRWEVGPKESCFCLIYV